MFYNIGPRRNNPRNYMKRVTIEITIYTQREETCTAMALHAHTRSFNNQAKSQSVLNEQKICFVNGNRLKEGGQFTKTRFE